MLFFFLCRVCAPRYAYYARVCVCRAQKLSLSGGQHEGARIIVFAKDLALAMENTKNQKRITIHP